MAYFFGDSGSVSFFSHGAKLEGLLGKIVSDKRPGMFWVYDIIHFDGISKNLFAGDQ